MSFEVEITEEPGWLLELSVAHITEEVTEFGTEIVTETDPTIFQMVTTETSIEFSDVGLQGPPGPQGVPGVGTLTLTLPAGHILSGHRLVTTDNSGHLVYASADNLSQKDQGVWLTTYAGVTDEQMVVVGGGAVTEPSWSWTPHQKLYLGMDGYLTQIPPTNPAVFVRIVGNALTPTSIWYRPHPAISLV